MDSIDSCSKRYANKINFMSILISVFFALIAISCNKIANETDPSKIIMGKWQVIQYGNWPIMQDIPNADGYSEFKNDSVLLEIAFTPYEVYKKRYWIDSLVHEQVFDEIGNEYVTVGVFKYEFFDKNRRMRLDYAIGVAEFKTGIYKRLK
jgi:hypothetical protein